MAKKTKKNQKVIEEDGCKFEVANIADMSEEWLNIFAANVNIQRITNHAIDGLKPVSRRALYAMHRNSDHGNSFRKVQRIMGDALAYHPHGDGSIADSIYNMGQSWNQNIMMITKNGNFGNCRGDEPAAPRYTEAKLSKAAQWIYFADLKNSNVPMQPSYDGKDVEPDYLPAKIPIVLCNPHFSGIGIGVAANIPPFNPSDVIKATIKLMKNPKAEIVLIPDSPSGCDIIDDGQFEQMNQVGDDCTVTMQATYEIDYVKNIVRITSLPLQVTAIQVIKNIIKLRKLGKLDELIDLTDECKKDKIRINLFLKRSENPEKFVQKILERKTGLKKTYPVEIRVISEFRAHVWGTKKLLLEWIDYRRDCVRAIYNKKLMQVTNDNHMNELYIFITNESNSKKAIQIALSSRNKSEAEKSFMQEFKVSSLQAQTLAKMSVHQFTEDARASYLELREKYATEILNYEDILRDDEAVDKIIIDELRYADKTFCGPRRSAIIKSNKHGKEYIEDTMHLVGISKDGYIKKVPIDYASIGSVGKQSQVIVTMISNRDNLLIFDSSGRISRVGVSSIPNMEQADIGVELERYFKLSGEPISVVNESNVSKSDTNHVIMVTKRGLGKKVLMSEFAKIKDYKQAMPIDESDSLVSVIPAGDEEFVIYTDIGDGVRLHIKDIKEQSRKAKGLSLISLRPGEEVVGINFIRPGSDKVLYITSNGRMKLTEEKYFPIMNRKDEPISLIGLNDGELLIGVAFVSTKDSVTVYRKKGKPVTVAIHDIPITSRVAKADKFIKLPGGDKVTGFRITISKRE